MADLLTLKVSRMAMWFNVVRLTSNLERFNTITGRAAKQSSDFINTLNPAGFLDDLKTQVLMHRGNSV